MARRRKKKQEETLVDLVEARDSAQGFIEENQNIILGALLGVVLLIGGVFAYNNFYKKPRMKEAVEQMYQAELQFERDSFAQALDNPGGGNPGFLDIAKQYSGTPAGNLAKYYAGVCWLRLGKYEAAIEQLQNFSPDGKITPALKNSLLGDAHAELNQMDEAMKYYKKAAAAAENEEIATYTLKKLGLFCENQGDLAAAKQYFEEIRVKYPNTADGRDIEKYISRVSQ